MTPRLRVLIIEDREEDSLRLLFHLRQGGFDPDPERADSAEGLAAALEKRPWDVVLADYGMPRLSGLDTLRIVQQKAPGLPVILVFDTFADKTAVEAKCRSAYGCLTKDTLARLAPAVTRGLRETTGRRDRALFEETLLLHEEILRRLTEGILLTHGDRGTIDFATSRLGQMFGYGPSELLGKPASMLHAPEEDGGEAAADAIESALAKTGRWSGKLRNIRKDGTTFWCQADISDFKHPRLGGIRISVYQDITEHKEQELRQSLSTTIFRILGETTHHESIFSDILLAIKHATGLEAVGIRLREGDDYPYIAVNGFPPAFLKTERYLCVRGPGGEPLRGASGDIVLGCMCGDILRGRTDPSLPFFTKGGSFWTNGTARPLAAAAPEQRQAHTRDACDMAGYESVALIPLRAKDRIIGLLQLNDHRKGRFTLDMIEFFEGLSASIAIALDRQLADKQKTKLESDLRQSQKMEVIGRLAGGVAHDFNNLMTAILGNCGFLLRDMPKDDPRRADVEEIKKAGERAADLTRQLLAFSRKQILQPRALRLDAMLADVKKLLQRIIGEDIRLTVACSENLPLVKADHGQIGQVILNLAVNARDAMPKGGRLTITAHDLDLSCGQAVYQGSCVPPGRYVLLTVADTGSGIDARALEHIFEPFFTTKGLGKGTGLGLSTVYGIVKQSDGFIDVHSEPSQGTTFKIFLPAVSAAVPEDEEEEERGDEERKKNSRRTILVVEDEDVVRRTAARMLKTAGYTVLEAASAREALQNTEGHLDLLLTDIVLPDISGMELGARLKKSCPHLESIFMSGYTDNPEIREVLSRLENRFLQKPFTAKALLAKVQEALA